MDPISYLAPVPNERRYVHPSPDPSGDTTNEATPTLHLRFFLGI